MTIISRSDLQYTYEWSAIAPDDPKLTGRPDDAPFNRHEGYEVLAFLNFTAADTEGARKAERLIREHLPSDIRSRRRVLDWLIENWTLA